MNRNKRYVSLFNSTESYRLPQYCVAVANLGKTSVKFWHAASLPRQECSVNLRIGRGKTSVNGQIFSGGTVTRLIQQLD